MKINGKAETQYDANGHVLIDENDQLVKICNRKHDNIDTSFLTNEEQVNYIKNLTLVNQGNKETFTEMLPDSHDELVAMLESMTEFNPYFRPSARQLLKNKIFDDIRKKDIEENAPFKITIDIDQYDCLKS